MQTEETTINTSMSLQNQLLATKFFVPVAPCTLITRPRLTALLQESLKYPFTLVSAPAGFGKTTLLSSWAQSLPASHPRFAWVSLDEEDNEPHLFWTAIIAALDMHHPGRFTPLLASLQASQGLLLKYILTALINLLQENREHFLLILDDYQMITEHQIHTTLSYLIQHLPLQLHIILSTRADPPLPLSQMRARQQILEVRTDQLRCTTEETKAFFHQTIDTQLPDEIIQQITTRTEGWLVGLQLLALSLPAHPDLSTLLQEVSGEQRYILDFLTQEVLERQPQEVQTFLLSTCILQRLSSSLCDAVMQQAGSQQMLQQLEQANLFVVSLDSKREWYRYHALFAQALCYRLEHTHGDLLPILHYRASLWYAQHNQITEAILHAFSAHQWQWAADLIERIWILAFTWGAGEHELVLLRQYLEQLPADIVHSRPRLCLTCARILWQTAPHPTLQGWLNAAETMLAASLTKPSTENTSHTRQDQENLLGEVFAFRAFLQSFQQDGQATLSLCQQALALLSADNFVVRAHVVSTQLLAYYTSSDNDALAAVESGLQGISLAQAGGQTALAISLTAITALYMIGVGQLHKAQQLIQQAIEQGKNSAELALPEVGWLTFLQAEILREWNRLDAALPLAEEALLLCQQTESLASLTFLLWGYAVLLRVFLSRSELEAARSTLQQIEHVGSSMNQPLYISVHSFFTTVDQVRLWLACSDLDFATRWAEELDIREQQGTPFAHEREEVARIRLLLANNQPALALQRLKPVLQRATTGQRWGHVIEILLLQALAHEMRHEETLALDCLSEAVRLAEPECYIRSFVDEGPPMASLLSRLREQQHEDRPTPYLDTLLAAFPSQSQVHKDHLKRTGGDTMTQPLLDPLSEREQEVLHLLARGASNQEIAQELAIVVDTVKRHVSHIFSKLGVQNRVQVVRQARTLGLVDVEDRSVS